MKLLCELAISLAMISVLMISAMVLGVFDRISEDMVLWLGIFIGVISIGFGVYVTKLLGEQK